VQYQFNRGKNMETTETIESVETSEPVVQETTEPVVQTEIVTPKLREAKIEVEGRQMAINESQLKALWGLPENEELTDKEFKSLVSAYKAQKTADSRSQQASRQEKLVKEIAEMIQNNPWGLLQNAGHDPRKLAEEYLTQAIEEEMLPENERELRKIRAEKEELERQYREELTRKEQQQIEQAVVQAQQEITSQIIDSLENSNLPKTPDVVQRIAKYMYLAESKGINAPIKQIIPLVEQDLKNLNASILKSLDPNNRINYIGEDLLKQIRQDDLARLKRPESKGTSVPQAKPNQNKKLTKEEFRQILAERVRS
jgi:hypothetical protein